MKLTTNTATLVVKWSHDDTGASIDTRYWWTREIDILAVETCVSWRAVTTGRNQNKDLISATAWGQKGHSTHSTTLLQKMIYVYTTIVTLKVLNISKISYTECRGCREIWETLVLRTSNMASATCPKPDVHLSEVNKAHLCNYYLLVHRTSVKWQSLVQQG